MRKSTAVVVVLTGTMFVVSAAQVFGAPQSITGKLIDLACYRQDKANTGNQHVGKAGILGGGLICAQACALEGFPVGLLTADGKVYHVTGNLAADNNAKLVPHMAHTVTITGDVNEKAGEMTIAGNDLKMAGK
jgi:hypothetical protein